MYLQYCARRCDVVMSVLELIGIIKLSYRQAEGQRLKDAVLCLKYILSMAAVFAFTWLCLRESGKASILLAVVAAGAALIAVGLRGFIRREAYQMSVGYLRPQENEKLRIPGIPALLSGELVFLATVWTVNAVMMSPAFICLRYGIRYYSLSSDRNCCMLLLAAAFLLTAGGLIFSAVTSARMGCAEYLWFSGQCSDMLFALDCSWELTAGQCGDMLRLRWLSLFCDPLMTPLCEMNYSHRLMKRNETDVPRGIYVEIIRDARGEQFIELAAD